MTWGLQQHFLNKTSATSFLFKMIAKLEWTQSNAYQNKDKHRNTTHNGNYIKQQIKNTEPPPKYGQQPKPLGDPNAFHWHQIFALDAAIVEAQKTAKLILGLLNHCNASPWRNNPIKSTQKQR